MDAISAGTAGSPGVRGVHILWNAFFQIRVFIFLRQDLLTTFLKMRYLSRVVTLLKASFLTQQLPLPLDPTAPLF